MDTNATIQEVIIMGDIGKKLTRIRKKIQKPLEEKISKPLKQAVEKPFRKGATSEARDAANKQKGLIAKEKQSALLKKAEAEDEIARRRGQGTSKTSGRRSLIRSSGSGLSQTLGG
jgi:hypothetical protein